MTLEQRVEKLERQNRWLRRSVALMFALAACGTLMAQKKDESPAHIEGLSLTLKGSDGSAFFEARKRDDGSVLLDLQSEKGKARVQMIAEPHCAAVRLYDRWGNKRAVLGGESDSRAGAPGLALFDVDGALRVDLSLSDLDAPSLALSDQYETERVCLLVGHRGQWSGLYFHDGENTQRALLSADSRESTLVLRDASGEVTWRTPTKRQEAAK
jgi:hypothetical protein